MSRIKLKQIAIEKNERIDNPSQSSYTRFVGLEHYDSGEATIRRYGSTERLESTMKVFRAGDILVARRNVYLKRAATVDFDGLTSGDSIVLHIENEVYRRIIPFVLNTDEFWDYANQHADGSMSKRLSPKLLMEYEFSIPDDNLEQISSILWAMERVKTAYRELIAKTDELVKSQFIEIFGNTETNERGLLVKPWNDVFSTTTGKLDSNAMVERGAYPFFTCAKESYWIDKYAFDCEALLLAGNNAVGVYDVKHYKGKFNAYQRTYVLQLKNEAWSYEFFKNQLELKLEELREKSIGTNTRYLTLKILGGIDFLVPDVAEQDKWMAFVRQSDKSKFEAQQAMENLRVAQKALMRQHLTK